MPHIDIIIIDEIERGRQIAHKMQMIAAKAEALHHNAPRVFPDDSAVIEQMNGFAAQLAASNAKLETFVDAAAALIPAEHHD